MTIRFDCQFCGKTLKADDAKAGMKVKCPSCEGMLTIPELPSTEVAEVSIEPPEPPVADKPVPSGRKMACPVCDEPISPRDSVCPWCGEETKRAKKRQVTYPVAGPVQRLYGAILDTAAMMLFVAPGAVLIVAGLIAAQDQQEPPIVFLLGTLGVAGGGLVYLVIQVYLLMQRSQSIGKYFAKMQIMDYETDQPASLLKTFLLRYLVNQLIGHFTCSILYFPVDALFVFSEEHRCLHDQIAGTYVVDLNAS